jgi:hypothetical protein
MVATVTPNGKATKVASTDNAGTPLTLQAHPTLPNVITLQLGGHQAALSQTSAAELWPFLQRFAQTGSLT